MKHIVQQPLTPTIGVHVLLMWYALIKRANSVSDRPIFWVSEFFNGPRKCEPLKSHIVTMSILG